MAENNSVNDYTGQIDSAIAAREKTMFNEKLDKFFKQTITNIEDILLEQWQANDYNKTMTNAIEHIAYDVDNLRSELIPLLKNNDQEITTPIIAATDSMSSAIVESISNLPALYKDDDIILASARPVTEVEDEKRYLANEEYKNDMFFLFDAINDNIKYIAQHYRELKRSKRGSVGEPFGKEKPDDGKGFFELLGAAFSFKAFKNTLKSLFAKSTGFIGKIFTGLVKGVWGLFGKMFPKTAAFLSKAFIKLLGPIAKKMAPLLVKAIPFVGWAIAIGDMLWDFFKGFSDDAAAELLGKKKDQLTMWDKVTSGLTSLLSGLTLGFIDKKTILPFTKKIVNTVKDLWAGLGKMVPNFFKEKIFAPIMQKINAIKDFKFGDFFSGLLDPIKNAFNNAPAALGDLKDKAVELVKNIASTIWNILKSIVDDMLSVIPSVWSDIKGLFGSETKAKPETITKPLNVAAEAKTSDLEIQKIKAMNKPANERPINIQVPQQKPSASVDRSVNSGRDALNMGIANAKSFSFS